MENLSVWGKLKCFGWCVNCRTKRKIYGLCHFLYQIKRWKIEAQVYTKLWKFVGAVKHKILQTQLIRVIKVKTIISGHLTLIIFLCFLFIFDLHRQELFVFFFYLQWYLLTVKKFEFSRNSSLAWMLPEIQSNN